MTSETQDSTRPATNWGRWGEADERGALNLLTPETVLAATRLCRTGKTYSLALPIQREGMPVVPYRVPPQRFTQTKHPDDPVFVAFGNPDVGSHEGVLIFPSHNETHLDAFCHVHHLDLLYNGFPARSVRDTSGAEHCGIDKVGSIVGRAVLLDVAGHLGDEAVREPRALTAADLLACADAQRVEIRSGDILLVRTGWLRRFLANPDDPDAMTTQTGLGMDAVNLLRERDVVAVGADNSAVEVIPFDGEFLAVHVALLVQLGVHLLEHLNLEQLAADRAYETLFVAAPLPVQGATGSPINPIAIA
jgi:kynurenine formamidase